MVKKISRSGVSKGKDFVDKIIEKVVPNSVDNELGCVTTDSTKKNVNSKSDLDVTEEKENHPVEEHDEGNSRLGSPSQKRSARPVPRPDYKAMSGTKASVFHITSTTTKVKLKKIKCSVTELDSVDCEDKKQVEKKDEVEVLEQKVVGKKKKSAPSKESAAVLKRKGDPRVAKKATESVEGNDKSNGIFEAFYEFVEKKAKLGQISPPKDPKKIVVKRKSVTTKVVPTVAPMKSANEVCKEEHESAKLENTDNKKLDKIERIDKVDDPKIDTREVKTKVESEAIALGSQTKECGENEDKIKTKDTKEEKSKKSNVKKTDQKEEVTKASKKTKSKPAKESDTESESEEEAAEQKALMEELKSFFKENNLKLKPRKPTRGDGNCWFRSVVDQISLYKVKGQPTTHPSLRLAICNYLKDLPEEVKNNTVDIIYKGKRRGLADLAHRQRKLGQFVDDFGIMVMATALYLNRNIEVYSAKDGGGFFVTNIDGGDGADKREPFTVFYFKDYQHYQSVCRT